MEIKKFSRVQVVANYPLISLKGEMGNVRNIDGDTYTVELDNYGERHFRKEEITLPLDLIQAKAEAEQHMHSIREEQMSFADLLDELANVASYREDFKYPQILEGMLQQEITRRAKAGQLD